MFEWIALILGSLFTVISAYISFQDKTDFKSQSLKRKSRLYLITFIVAIVGAALSLSVNIKTKLSDQRNSLKAKMLNDSLLKTHSALINSQKQNSDLLKEQNTYLMGKGNRPYLMLSRQSTHFKTNASHLYYRLDISNNGQNPIRDLRGTIFSTKKFTNSKITSDSRSKFKYGDYSEYFNDFEIGTLSPGTKSTALVIQIPKIILYPSFLIIINWENGENRFYITSDERENEHPTLRLELETDDESKYIIFNN